jgi:hypothetical protein
MYIQGVMQELQGIIKLSRRLKMKINNELIMQVAIIEACATIGIAIVESMICGYLLLVGNYNGAGNFLDMFISSAIAGGVIPIVAMLGTMLEDEVPIKLQSNSDSCCVF